MPATASHEKHIGQLLEDPSHDQGCVTKHYDGPGRSRDYPNCSYRLNGRLEIEGNAAKRAVYEVNFTLPPAATRVPATLPQEVKSGGGGLRTPDDPRADASAWHFGGDHFKKGYLPYNHDYHHMLPFSGIQNLSYKVLRLVQTSGYNLNNGCNMIILPKHPQIARALQLPNHPSDHRDYTREVRSIVKKIKNSVKRKGKNKKKHRIRAANVGNFKQQVESWQDTQFWALVAWGRRSGAGTLVNQMPLGAFAPAPGP